MQSLLDYTPKPLSTSAEALANHKISGKHGTNMAKVLAAVRSNPGKTYRELADIADIDPVECMRRLGDLQQKKLVVKTGEFRNCSIARSRCTTWEVNRTEGC